MGKFVLIRIKAASLKVGGVDKAVTSGGGQFTAGSCFLALLSIAEGPACSLNLVFGQDVWLLLGLQSLKCFGGWYCIPLA